MTRILLALFAIACVGHTLVAGLGVAGEPGDWPARRGVPGLAWIEQEVRGLERIGWVPPEGAAHDWVEFRRSKAEAAIAPTRVVDGVQDVTLFLFAPRQERAARTQVVQDQGLVLRRMPPKGVFGLGEHERVADRPRVARGTSGPQHHEVRWARLLFVAVVLVAGVGSAARHAREAAGLVAASAPLAWAFAAALADALPIGELGFHVAWLFAFGMGHGAAIRAVPAGPPRRAGRLPVVVGLAALLAGVALFALRLGAEPEGMLDAQVMFNLRARWILTDPAFWGPFHTPTDWPQQHLDYPPLLSFAVAGAWRALGTTAPVGPALVQLLTWVGAAVCASCWVARRSPWSGVLVLAALVASPYLARLAAWQVADGPLASWFVLACVLADVARRTEVAARVSGARRSPWARHAWVLAGVALGCAAWTKHEGAVIAGLSWIGAGLLVPRLRREGLDPRPALVAAIVVVLPLVAYHVVAPPNDLVSGVGPGHATLTRVGTVASRLGWTLLEPTPFRGLVITVLLLGLPRVVRLPGVGLAGGLVAVGLWRQGGVAWLLVATLLALVGLSVAWPRERDPGDSVALRLAGVWLLLALAVFAAVYVTTPYDLEWHLHTSLFRVLAPVHGPAVVVLALACARRDVDGPAGLRN